MLSIDFVTFRRLPSSSTTRLLINNLFILSSGTFELTWMSFADGLWSEQEHLTVWALWRKSAVWVPVREPIGVRVFLLFRHDFYRWCYCAACVSTEKNRRVPATMCVRFCRSLLLLLQRVQGLRRKRKKKRLVNKTFFDDEKSGIHVTQPMIISDDYQW